MSRQVTVSRKEIEQARAAHYAIHFDKYKICMASPARPYVVKILPNLPAPKVDLFGDLYTMYLTGENFEIFQDYRVQGVDLEYMVSWYWSELGWEDYRYQFEHLPEPLPKYVFRTFSRMPELVPANFAPEKDYVIKPKKSKKPVDK